MRRRLAAMLVAFSALCGAGCSSSTNTFGTPLAPNGFALTSPAASGKDRALLYVASLTSGGGTVSIFKQAGTNQQPIGTIVSGVEGPLGLFVDSARNLYVANALAGTIGVYRPGDTTPAKTLEKAGAPIDVVVARDGTVYVANDGDVFKHNAGGSVLEYRKGATTPSKTIVTFEKASWPRALALDSHDDLFVAYNRNLGASWKPHGHIVEFAPDSSKGRDLGIRVGGDGGLTIDRHNDLVLVMYGNSFFFPPSIDIFAPGKKKPMKVIPFPEGYPGYDVALNHTGTIMWLTCPSLGDAFALTYPEGKLVDTIVPLAGGFVTGVATSPGGSY